MNDATKNNPVDAEAAQTAAPKGDVAGASGHGLSRAEQDASPYPSGTSGPEGSRQKAAGRRQPRANAAPAKTGANGGGDRAPIYKRLEDVPDDLLELIDQMLVEGATFEDVAESLEGQGVGRVPLHVVATYFRSNLDLQKRRVSRQVEKAQELKKSLGDPESAEAKLADAIFVTGYMGVTRKGAEIKLKDVEAIRLGKENLRLRNQVLRHREKENRQQRRYRRLREDVMRKKLEFYQLKSAELKQAMAAERKQNKLGPETMRAIQEIYGIATIPSLPAEIR